MSRTYLYHFQPDPAEDVTLCGVPPGRVNGPTSAIDRAAGTDRFAHVVRQQMPQCSRCRKDFDAYLVERPRLAELYGLPT